MNRTIIFTSILLSGFMCNAQQKDTWSSERRKNVGIFRSTDKMIQGITYGNWGSRPYEYAWVSGIVPVAGKRVIDLGVGLPSQYNWYQYVVTELKPSFYVGVDWDNRILSEVICASNYEIKHMSMAALDYPDKSFDVAYCISTFEHLEYDVFMESIKEAYRILKDDGYLVITLDEEWDREQPKNHSNGWNTLEQSVIEKGLFKRKNRSFGLPEFLNLIEDFFVLDQEDAQIDSAFNNIYSNIDQFIYYRRFDKDFTILNSGLPTNSCVSYAVLKKKDKKSA